LYREGRVIGAVARVLGQVLVRCVDSDGPARILRGNLARKQATAAPPSRNQRGDRRLSYWLAITRSLQIGNGFSDLPVSARPHLRIARCWVTVRCFRRSRERLLELGAGQRVGLPPFLGEAEQWSREQLVRMDSDERAA